MELHGENPFKTKAIGNAAFRIGKSGLDLTGKSKEELEKIDLIGKGLAGRIAEIQESGTMAELENLLQKTPVGVVEMLSVKGLGPKKVKTIWKEMGIETLAELLYACNENRLVLLDGFGLKTQQSLKSAVEFLMANQGKLHFASAELLARDLEKVFAEILKDEVGWRLEQTGQLRRKCEVIDSLEWLVGGINPGFWQGKTETAGWTVEWVNEQDGTVCLRTPHHLPVILFHCPHDSFEEKWFETTAVPDHLKMLGWTAGKGQKTEEEIYGFLNLPFLVPEMREGRNELDLARSGRLNELIQFSDLKGILHNHTSYSDGLNTVAEMAAWCREKGFQYLGLCDHSQTAVYAGGLPPEKVLAQQAEIDALNLRLAPFRIFKGIESDILGNGDLDYEPGILKTFDFVVASVHSNLKMKEEIATQRLIKAIENPFTTILGHPTGRLLLARPGYPIDHKKIIEACSANRVAIELNAHPYRLDIDWRWIYFAMEKGVMIAINPDAHSCEGLGDMKFGFYAALKGGLLKSHCLNAFSMEELDLYFTQKRNA